MTRTPTPSRHLVALLARGFAAGLVLVAIGALVVVALSLAGSAFLLVLINVGFGGSGVLTGLLVVAGIVGALVGAVLLGRLLLRRLLPALAAWGRAGAEGPAQRAGLIGWLAALAGGLLGLGLAIGVMPEPIRSTARQFITGQTPKQHAEHPAVQVMQQRQQQLLAAHPEGPEAALLEAVNRSAAPVNAPGRLLTASDTQARVEALRQLLPSVPPGWRPVVLGTIAELLNDGGPPADGPRHQALMEAGRAGSRAYQVLAAQSQEEIAHSLPKSGVGGTVGGPADAAWALALQTYAAAGAAFEVARLYDETLPAHLRTLTQPPGPAAPAPADAALSQRLWRLAQALGDDMVWAHARPGSRSLAVAAALVALDHAPAATPIATVNPAQRWATSPWAPGRWVLALRHARGDCLAALALSDATRQRRRPPAMGQSQPGASPLDMAWAVAWMEAGQACARSDEERARVLEHKAQLDYLRLDPALLDAARAGVAASVAALR